VTPVSRARLAYVALASATLAAACASRGAIPPAASPAPSAAACTVANPIAEGADPWVVRHDGSYYYVKSSGDAIWISRSPTLTGVVAAPATRVWTAPDTGWNRTNIWAPELHFIDGRWYVYYAGGRSGPPFLTQHAGVLQSTGPDALGSYVDRGKLYTGDSVGTGTGDRWSIDLTVAQIGTRRYAVWSGWKQNAITDRTPQQLYIAPMTNPWTIAANRVLLSEPTERWERGTELDLQEGPEFLRHGDSVFLLYSTRESWLPDYRLGQLRLRSGPADPADPASWTKSGPVFTGRAGVYGVGHASFTTSPDDSESWIVYHSKTSAAPGWRRVVRMQRFAWSADGAPSFGEPVAAGDRIPLPAGECR
jgi:GH43 family beta-xylosidase